MDEFLILEKKIGISFKNKDLLIQAFCHRSYLNENPNFYLGHNERLEFLGDAVLELVITEYLFEKYPEKPEGEMTSLRASLVNTKILSETSNELNFNEFLLLSRGEISENGRSRQSILANVFEALVGAIYLDGGYDLCKNFIEKNLIIKLERILKFGLYRDSKSKFQEEAQSKEGITPSYKTLEEFGPDHKKTFIIGVFLKEKMVAKAQGFSKQEAEELAAKKALKIKNWN